jgi:hypothetical protein
MRARLILIAAAGVLLGTLAMAPPAQAGHLDWSFGIGFHVDGLRFQIGYAPYGHAGYPGPFFFTGARLHHPRHTCNGLCFRSGAGYYHHASCPLLGFHFGRIGYGPSYYVQHYAPYRGYGRGYYPYRSRAYGRYYRHGYRDRFRAPDRRHYRGDRVDHRHRGRHHYRPDRGRRSGYDHDRDRGRSYRDDRDRRGGRGDRERARPRRGARHTRPPR